MIESMTTKGLTRQPPKANRGNTDPAHPWRHKKLAFTEKEKAARLKDRLKPTTKVGRDRQTLYGSSTACKTKTTTDAFVCVSCGDPNCVGGECAARWDR